MNKWLRDVIVIPLAISLIVGFLFMIWGALFSNVPWHSPFSPHWIKAFALSPVPLWITLAIVFIASIIYVRKLAVSSCLRKSQNNNKALQARLDDKVRAHDERLFRLADGVLQEETLANVFA